VTGQPRRTDREHWESQAENWAGFTRGPLPDAYPSYAPRFFPFLPPPGRATLEIGCGEGRVCRDLRALGYDPIGIDGSSTMIRLAADADPAGDYRVADAAALPFADRAFDLVVAYNVLMDVDDLDGVVAEAARVIEPGGHLAACVTHPFADVGRFVERSADAPFVVTGDYLAITRYGAEVTRNDVTMEFGGWARPINAYAAALERSSLLIEAIREPAAPDEDVAADPAERRWQRMPQFLWFRAVKPG
jgi:SAM-dependent methyltransferase